AYWTLWVNLNHICALYFATSSTLVKIFHIQVCQLLDYCAGLLRIPRRLTTRQFAYLRVKFVRALELLHEINQSCGTPFLSFILLCLPVNATVLIWIIQGQVCSPFHRLFIGSCLAYHYNIMFVIHLVLTRCSGCLNLHGKLLLAL